MSPPANPNDLTRHQLDELDALLQRMLSLPLGSPSQGGAAAEDRPAALTLPDIPPMPPPSGAGHWRGDAGPTPRLPQLMTDPTTLGWGHDGPARSTPANFHVPTLPPPTVEVIPETIPLFGPPQGEARTLRGVDAPALPIDYRPEPAADVVLTPAPAPVPAGVAPASAAMFAPPGAPPAREPVPAAVWPVYAVNALLEAALDLTGPFGKLFTNRVSKQVLGWSGVALVALSAAWLARGYGLIDFPLPTATSVASALGR